jgi:hypothetical protein
VVPQRLQVTSMRAEGSESMRGAPPIEPRTALPGPAAVTSCGLDSYGSIR